MADILAVTWGEEELTLRRVPSEGLWNSDARPLKRVPLQRPTRAGRLDHPKAGGALGVGLTELLAEVDINIPCWLLLPNNWTLRFITDPPDLKSPDLILNHLRWESKQRLAGDPADYKISAAILMGGSKYFVCLTRTEVIQRCLAAAEAAELDLAGIGLEPNPGENYTFEHPLDLRDALPLESEADSVSFKAKPKTSPAAVVVFVLVVLSIIGYLVLSGDPAPKPAKKPPETAQKIAPKAAMTPQQAATPPVEVSTTHHDSTKETAVKESPQEKPKPEEKVAPKEPPPHEHSVTPAITAVPGSSPVRSLFASLPAGAKAELVVLSPVDLKVELSGIASPEQWLSGLKKQPGWGSASMIGNYDTPIGKVVAVRIENPGWSSSGGIASDAWQAPAKAAGLTIKGKVATGGLDAAMNLVDQLWKSPAGLSKLYLAPVEGNWQITVQ